MQTYIAKKAANYLSGELHTRIRIESLYIKPFKSVVLEGLYVEDLQQDTLLYSPKFSIDLNFLSIKARKISVQTVQLDNGKFYLKDFKDKTTNLDFIINYFDSGRPQPAKKPSSKPYAITFDRIKLDNFQFRYKNFRIDTLIRGINFDDILLRNLNADLADLNTKNHLLQTQIRHLSFIEKSGFELEKLQADAVIDTNRMEFKNLLLQTTRSRISDYVQLSYKKFIDFNNFIRKVKVKAELKDALIDPRDIAFFTPEVQKMTLPVQVNGAAEGYVNNFKAQDFSVKAGRATYLRGDFSVKGLPKINETFLDLEFEQVSSNKKDTEYIIRKLTGNSSVQIPDIIEKFGNVNFKGKFTGFITDFIAYGEFKTRLGRIVSDVNMKMQASPIYKGTLKAYNFDIGSLLNEKSLGRTTALIRLNGTGFEQQKLKEELNASVDYLEFRGYRYRNMAVNGNFNRNRFTGEITVNDPNLILDFDGNIDLNPELPEFNFEASVQNASLNKLKLTKDTILIDADFKTNFTGNSLDNIQGDLELRRIQLTNTDHSLVVDSVSLSAQGIGASRSLTVRSDILDAGINGQYDLNTLPSYFKSVVKRYIPSLQVKMVNPAPQDFDFDLRLKNFDPITLLFLPDLKIPDGAVITGKFVSSQNVAALNAFAKTASYKGVKVHNFILDETTGDKAMNLFITADQIDLTDSIYIKNINIANILRNDSLNLNIKLSDVDATNQLDLNGLVRFSRDSSAVFSILPSEVVISREVWKIQEQVSIGFDKGKIDINDFVLQNGSQQIKINGIVSADPEDKLLVNFDQFNLASLNTLTKPAGIRLGGRLNGGISLAAITANPRINSNLLVDSLYMNDIEVGRVDLKAGFDNETKLVEVGINILKQNKETLNIRGTYNAAADNNSLDMAVKMDNSELVIFQPFLKRLVSNLTGKVSADLLLSGTVFSPRIDGSLDLLDARLVVNYLKTPYRINDRVRVENSVIHLSDLVIRDIKDHQAVANGTVDMNNPNNPDINVTIRAEDFMALNTTAKDNQDYYGTAYGTGTFRFNGPTDNMEINIDAKTEAGTVFNIPLNSSEMVSDNQFITFVSKDSTVTPKKQNVFKGLTMNFDLVVDQNSEVNIFTDLGRLTGRGESELLNLKISSSGEFTMLGTYNISQGKFEFTAQDFINKVFQISEGGSIRWVGDPADAVIDLKAVYEVRTSLRDLYIAAGRPPEDQRTLAQAIMNLNGSLLHPDISFDLNFPTDTYIKDELQGYLSDVNNRNTQALSLIVRRSFSPNTGNVFGTVNSTLASAGTELFFNQFNNILAQSLNLNFVDFNIRSLNEASASVRLWNDRLAFTYGITDRRTELSDYNFIGNSIARDVEALYLIKKDGSLVLRASNRLNNRTVLNLVSPGDEYVSAIGLVYRQEFDNLKEFLRILIGRRRQEERNKPNNNPPPVSPAARPDENQAPPVKEGR